MRWFRKSNKEIGILEKCKALDKNTNTLLVSNYSNILKNKNTLSVKKVRGQSEAALQIGMCDQIL